jgi:predicted transposase YdaD
MSHPFDAILKHLPQDYPQDWARFAGVEAPVSVIDADVSTVTAAADKVLWVEESQPWILHLEFQASHDATLGSRVLHYNVLLRTRHKVPVRSLVILLRREADGRDLTGTVQWRWPSGRTYLTFEYEPIRLWQLPPEAILQGGLGTLPLAPLTRVSRPELPGLIQQMDRRIDREAEPPAAQSLWTATYVLMGLEYEREFTQHLLRGVCAMKESVTYQAILEEGRAEEAQRILLSLGTVRFGKPSVKVRRALAGITDVELLETLLLRVVKVNNWTQLLADLP